MLVSTTCCSNSTLIIFNSFLLLSFRIISKYETNSLNFSILSPVKLFIILLLCSAFVIFIKFSSFFGYFITIKQEVFLLCNRSNIKAKLHWIHVASSSVLTYYMLHQKRGRVAMDAMEIIPNYNGILVHDHWTPYNKYTNSAHSYCNAHILRELNGITQKDNVKWSEDMHRLLTNMNIAIHKAKDNAKKALTNAQIQKYTLNYEKIIKSAESYYPPPNDTLEKARGRPKQEKGKNLLDRLSKYQIEHLRFLNDFRVPFTNNLAERDLRMIKVKEKISGSFASFKGGEIFCRVRSYISTLKKNNISVLQGLRDALAGKAYIPVGVGC